MCQLCDVVLYYSERMAEPCSDSGLWGVTYSCTVSSTTQKCRKFESVISRTWCDVGGLTREGDVIDVV